MQDKVLQVDLINFKNSNGKTPKTGQNEIYIYIRILLREMHS